MTNDRVTHLMRNAERRAENIIERCKLDRTGATTEHALACAIAAAKMTGSRMAEINGSPEDVVAAARALAAVIETAVILEIVEIKKRGAVQ